MKNKINTRCCVQAQDTTPGSVMKKMLDNIIYGIINDRKNKKEKI